MTTPYTVISAGSKTPRFAAKIVFAAGRQSAGSTVGATLIIALKGTLGSAVPGVVYDIVSEDLADALGGQGCMGAVMCRAAMKVPGARVKAIFVAEPVAGTAATASYLIGGTWTTAGDGPQFTIGGYTFGVAISGSMDVAAVGAAIVSAVNSRGYLPVTASFDTATVTFTAKMKGQQGKSLLIYVNKAGLPAGMTGTLTGAVAAGTNRVFMGESSSGTGSVDLTATLAILDGTERFSRIAVGANDAINAGLVEAYVDAKSTWDRMLFEQAMFATSADYATAQTLAKSTLNAFRCSVLWARYCEVPWWEFLAEACAARATYESSVPNWDSDAYVFLCAAGRMTHRYLGDAPSNIETDLALSNGVTPISTVLGTLRIVRGITSYCVNASALPDERCLDWADPSTPDYVGLDLHLRYLAFREQNTLVGPNPPPELGAAPEGVATPDMWKGELEFAANDPIQGYFARGFITSWRSDAAYNVEAGDIESLFELTARRLQHKLSVVIRQTSGL